MMQPRDKIRVTFLVTALLATAWPVLAQDNFAPNVNPSLQARMASGEIKIDGRLDDPGWRGAAMADNFCETLPGTTSNRPWKPGLI